MRLGSVMVTVPQVQSEIKGTTVMALARMRGSSGPFRRAAAIASIGLAVSFAAGSQTLAQQTPPPAATAFAPLPDAPQVDEARAKLGFLLFFDNRLSGDTGNACSTC